MSPRPPFSRRSSPVAPCLIGLVSLLLIAAGASAAPAKVALLVANRTGEALAGDVATFEDFLTASIVREDFQVISPEVTQAAVSGLTAREAAPDELEAVFAASTSALRLAQTLGADFLLLATLSSYGQEQRAVEAYDTRFEVVNTTLRVTYRLIDGGTGAALVVDAAEVTESLRQTAHATVSSTDLHHRLLSRASSSLAASLRARARPDRRPPPTAVAAPVPFFVRATIEGMTVPEVIVQADGGAEVASRRLALEPLGVVVEIDGIALGAAGTGTPLLAPPGLHRLRLSREGFEPIERMVNVFDGLRLSFALQMDEAGAARWREQTAFLQDLKAGAQLDAAEVERLRGEAQRLRQGGVRIQGETEEALSTENTDQSPFR